MPLSARPSSGSAASSSRAPVPASVLTEAAVHEANEHEMAIARQNMEERWLMRRHRDIANQMIDEERHAAVAVWAERRARVEEEIAANAEAMRFQSELWQRGYAMPADAQEDIAVTAASQFGEQGQPEQLSAVQSRSALSDVEAAEEEDDVPSADDSETLSPRGDRPQSALVGPSPSSHDPQPAPRYDVSRLESDAGRNLQIRAPSKNTNEVPTAKNVRIARIRHMHKHLLRDASDDEEINDEYDSTAPRCIFETAEGENHVSLSKYTQDQNQALDPAAQAVTRVTDDSDVIATVCDWWRTRHGTEAPTLGDAGITLDEMRLKQQQEAAAAKRRLAHWNRHVSGAVVDAALVMPMHVHKVVSRPGQPDGTIFNGSPDLCCIDDQCRDLLQSHPWAKEYLAKKACLGGSKKKKKKARARGKGARSPRRKVAIGKSSPR